MVVEISPGKISSVVDVVVVATVVVGDDVVVKIPSKFVLSK
jgi:hypothetical protein